MSNVTKAPYVFIAQGKVMFSGDDPQEMLSRLDISHLGGVAVKSWRVHIWAVEEGLTQGVMSCLSCKEYRKASGANKADPCPFPERYDPSISIIKPNSERLYQKV